MKKLSGHESISLQEQFLLLADYCENNEVDHDQYGNGKFLNQFEEEVANLTGMEAGLFMPSGVMAQLIAVRIYSDQLKSKYFACHPTCHLLLHEEDAYKTLHNLEVEECGHADKVTTLSDLQALENDISSLILELPLRHLGGDLPSWDELVAQKKYCKENKIKLHLDGARIFECQNYYGKSVKEIAADTDSLFLSFYKGFGSSSGSMLLGGKEFIEEAKIWLRRHGGNLFQLYPLAIAAKLNFDSRLDKFNQYVEKAHEIGEVLNTLPSVTVLPYPVKTNMLHFEFPKSKAHLQNQMKDYKEKGFDIGMGIWLEEPKGVSRLELSVGDATLRLSKEEIRELFQALLES
ncbi:MAG: threonine aldolase [Candidatus Azotimanducaceae bacterium]|jgi:threonine aldolase